MHRSVTVSLLIFGVETSTSINHENHKHAVTYATSGWVCVIPWKILTGTVSRNISYVLCCHDCELRLWRKGKMSKFRECTSTFFKSCYRKTAQSQKIYSLNLVSFFFLVTVQRDPDLNDRKLVWSRLFCRRPPAPGEREQKGREGPSQVKAKCRNCLALRETRLFRIRALRSMGSKSVLMQFSPLRQRDKFGEMFLGRLKPKECFKLATNSRACS